MQFANITHTRILSIWHFVDLNGLGQMLLPQLKAPPVFSPRKTAIASPNILSKSSFPLQARTYE